MKKSAWLTTSQKPLVTHLPFDTDSSSFRRNDHWQRKEEGTGEACGVVLPFAPTFPLERSVWMKSAEVERLSDEHIHCRFSMVFCDYFRVSTYLYFFLLSCCLTINFLLSIFPPSSQTPLLVIVPISFCKPSRSLK